MRELILFGSVCLCCHVYFYFIVRIFRRDKKKNLNDFLYFISIVTDMYISAMAVGSIPFFAITASVISIIHGGIQEKMLPEI